MPSGDSAHPLLRVVLAISYREFVDWCQRQGLDPKDRTLRYVGRPEHLLGVRDYELVNLGGGSAEIRDIIEEHRRRGFVR